MESNAWRLMTIGALALMTVCSSAKAVVPTGDLHATARDGQVFLTWKEAPTPDGTTFNVYVSDSAISDVTKAMRVGHHIEQHSAQDWWEDPASFTKHAPSGKPVGFRIKGNGELLDPESGLFVYSVRKDSRKRLFFAVTSSDRNGHEETALVAGANSMTEAIAVVPGEIKPIWLRGGEPPPPGAGKGKSLWLNLHAKGGVVPNMEYLVFGDESMGWREGLPFKFSVRLEGGEVVVRPTDRVWINRRHSEAADGGTNAIWTFWYGYNSRIYDRTLMGEGVPTNYTERRNFWILDWVRRHYQPDANRWYCSGGSMGGCGTVSFGMRHPELFAALHARVPIVSYTYLGKGSASRLEPSCWTGPIPPELKTEEGMPLLGRMNGVKLVSETEADLPLLFLINGRQDGSIPWENNPAFYRALAGARQGFAAYWDNGTHPTSGKAAPEDVKAWEQRFRRLRSDESFPAFTNTSSDRNPGNGQPDDGDIVGWINRGMGWKDIEDAADHYAITVMADYPGLMYPVRTDVTLRRVQLFAMKREETLSVQIGDAAPASIGTDVHGRLTIPGVTIASRDGVRIVIHRMVR